MLELDAKGHLVEKINLYQATANNSVLRAAEVFRPAVMCNCPALLLCHNHPGSDPAPSPKDRPQVTRYLIGISPEKGFFINPALLRSHTPGTAAKPKRRGVNQRDCKVEMGTGT